MVSTLNSMGGIINYKLLFIINYSNVINIKKLWGVSSSFAIFYFSIQH